MTMLARLRTFAHRYIVLPWGQFYYRRLWGMDIGRDVRISRRAHIDRTFPQGVHIGDFTAITGGASVLCHDFVNRRHEHVRIGANCFIGFNAVIMPGVTIGDHVIVTANSVVARDVPANTVVMGIPARVIEQSIVTGPWGIRLDRGDSTPVRH